MKVILLSYVEGRCEAPQCGRRTRKIYGTADGSVQDERKGPSLP